MRKKKKNIYERDRESKYVWEVCVRGRDLFPLIYCSISIDTLLNLIILYIFENFPWGSWKEGMGGGGGALRRERESK